MRASVSLVLVSFALVLLSGCLQSAPSVYLNATSGPGWVNITLTADRNITNATLELARPAELISCKANVCLFRYWQSPSDPTGEYTASYAVYSGSWHYGKAKVSLNAHVPHTVVDGVVFYGQNLTSALSAFNTTNVTVVARFTQNKSQANAIVIKAEVITIAALKALNKTVYFYAWTPENCTFTKPGNPLTLNLPEDSCRNAPEPKILIDLPYYPTDQVKVENATLVLEGSPSGLKDLASSTMYVLAKYLKRGEV